MSVGIVVEHWCCKLLSVNDLYTSRQRCFSYKELMSIEAFDNGEPLLRLNDGHSMLDYGKQPAKMVPYVGQGMYVRKGVADRLERASAILREFRSGAALKICYAYRHPLIQRQSFENFLINSRGKFPDLGEQDLLEYVHHYICVPEAAGHPAGAALDLTISESGIELDMGSPIGDFTEIEKVPTFSPAVTETQRANRLLLREVMHRAGFAPYDFEWWHFSFGDREWACYFGEPKTLYDVIEFAEA